MKNKRVALLSFPLFCCGLLWTLNFACQKKAEPGAATTTLTHPVFRKDVGGPIDTATAHRWKQNLLRKFSQQKATPPTPTVHFLAAAVLDSLITAPTAVGVCFYYGEDEQGRVHLVPIGVDAAGFVMPAPAVTTTVGPVSWPMAKAWRQRFKEHNPRGTWGYYWGCNAVRQLLAQGTEQVRIELGITDAGSQQLMFSNAALDNPALIYDGTRPCPSFCLHE